jgi:membrane protease YdiL (CAAX protease family)
MEKKVINGLKAALFLGLCYGFIQMAAAIPVPPTLSKYLFWAVIVSIFTWVLTHVFLKIEHKTLADIGIDKFNQLSKNLIWGLLWGIVLMTIMYGTMFALTNLAASKNPNTLVLDFLLHSIPVIFFLALMEELIFRGYAMFKLRQAIGIRGALYTTSVLFGLYHGLSFDAAFGPAMFGLLFGLMALWSKSLVLPTIFHFSVNWIQTLFGMKTQYTQGLYELSLNENIQRLPAETVGITLSVLLGVIGLVLIEVYIKKIKIDHTES